jgi:capsular polysaccharide biosynthesis protein
MDLVDVFKIALKRWYVVLAILVVGGTAAVLLASSVAPEYTIQTQSILVNGTKTDEDQVSTDSTTNVNPYLNFSGTEFTTASAMTRRVDGAEYRQQIADEGYHGTFVFSAAQEAPVVITDVTAASPQAAADLSDRVQKALRDALADLQAEVGAPDNAQIIMTPLTTSDPHEEVGSRNRVLFGILGVTVAAAIGGAVLLESLAQSRKRARVDEEDQVDEEEFEALERIRSLFVRDDVSDDDVLDVDEQSRDTGT